MRVCLVVGIVGMEGFSSRDIAIISWAMNAVCGVKWWPLNSCLYLLFLRLLRFALMLCFRGIAESFVL